MTAEATYHLDPETHRLRLVEYRDFVTETVRSLFPDPSDLRARWANRVGRREVLGALEAHGDGVGVDKACAIDEIVGVDDIAGRFGSGDALKEAVERLADLLYVA